MISIVLMCVYVSVAAVSTIESAHSDDLITTAELVNALESSYADLSNSVIEFEQRDYGVTQAAQTVRVHQDNLIATYRWRWILQPPRYDAVRTTEYDIRASATNEQRVFTWDGIEARNIIYPADFPSRPCFIEINDRERQMEIFEWPFAGWLGTKFPFLSNWTTVKTLFDQCASSAPIPGEQGTQWTLIKETNDTLYEYGICARRKNGKIHLVRITIESMYAFNRSPIFERTYEFGDTFYEEGHSIPSIAIIKTKIYRNDADDELHGMGITVVRILAQNPRDRAEEKDLFKFPLEQPGFVRDLRFGLEYDLGDSVIDMEQGVLMLPYPVDGNVLAQNLAMYLRDGTLQVRRMAGDDGASAQANKVSDFRNGVRIAGIVFLIIACILTGDYVRRFIHKGSQ